MQAKIVEITRDENGNLKEIYRPDTRTELRYPLRSGDSTTGSRQCNKPELCFAFTENISPDAQWVKETGASQRLDFYIK